jgi:uncharacterized protein YukE
MNLDLTHDQMLQKLGQIKEAQQHIEIKLRLMQDEQHSMLPNWQGQSANKYQTQSEQQHTDFRAVTKELQHVVATAEVNVNQVASTDS